VACAAAALLIAKLVRGAVDFPARLGLMRALLALVQLPLDDAVNDVGAWLKTKNVVRKLDRTGLARFNICYFGFHVSLTPSPAQALPPQPLEP
jgi:hypothetical protein